MIGAGQTTVKSVQFQGSLVLVGTVSSPPVCLLQLTLESSDKTLYGPNISPLVVDVAMETNERLHVKIYNPNNKRWEVPARCVCVCVGKLQVCVSVSVCVCVCVCVCMGERGFGSCHCCIHTYICPSSSPLCLFPVSPPFLPLLLPSPQAPSTDTRQLDRDKSFGLLSAGL